MGEEGDELLGMNSHTGRNGGGITSWSCQVWKLSMHKGARSMTVMGHHFQRGKRGIWVQTGSCSSGCPAPGCVGHLGVPKMSTHRAPRHPEGAFTAAKRGNSLADFINLLSGYMDLTESMLTTDNT